MEHDTTVVGCIHDEALSRLSDQVKFESVEIQDENKTWFGELCVGKDGFWVSSKSDASCSMWVKATDLVLQAICRDGPSKPGIYCQIQGEGDEETFQTIYIIPTESCYVEKIFEALCELVRRNPVSVSGEEDSDDNQWYGTVPWNDCNMEQFEDADETQ